MDEVGDSDLHCGDHVKPEMKGFNTKMAKSTAYNSIQKHTTKDGFGRTLNPLLYQSLRSLARYCCD